MSLEGFCLRLSTDGRVVGNVRGEPLGECWDPDVMLVLLLGAESVAND